MQPTPDMQARILGNVTEDRTQLAASPFAEPSDKPTALIVHRWEMFAETYPGTPTHIGEVEVQYNAIGNRAIYGFDAAGEVYCYMD